MAASAVPRLIAVVVLPTPPFWLAIPSTRGRVASGFAAGLPKGTTSGSAGGSGVGVSVMVGIPSVVRRASNRPKNTDLSAPKRLKAADHDDCTLGTGLAGHF